MASVTSLSATTIQWIFLSKMSSLAVFAIPFECGQVCSAGPSFSNRFGLSWTLCSKELMAFPFSSRSSLAVSLLLCLLLCFWVTNHITAAMARTSPTRA